MEFTVIESRNFLPVQWSGGTTKELFIFPLSSSYLQRNFQFRLSTAKVETETSEFTSLNGISRKLMVLDGRITLTHEGRYARELHKFDTDEFKGDWKTSSTGKCTDFNLMTSGKTSGNISGIVLDPEQNIDYTFKENCDWFFLYIYAGKVTMLIDEKKASICNGDLLVFNKPSIRNIEIFAVENSELVFVEITL